MQQNRLTRILIVGICVVLVVLAGGAVYNAENEPEQEQVLQREASAPAQNATASVENLEKISGSSDVESDLDLYIESTESMPNPNDFNDSYSDLKR